MTNNKRNKSPLKLIFGIVGVLIVLAFSMALTTTTTFAQQATTATPTATAEQTQAPASTPEAVATQTPGATGVIPVTGQNQAPNAVLLRAQAQMSNLSNANLEDKYNEALAKLHKQQRLLNNATNKLNQFTKQFGDAAFNSNNNQNQNNTSQRRNRRMQLISDEFATLVRNIALAQRQVLIAESALNGHVGFDVNGNLVNRQAAINTMALVETSLTRSGFSVKQIRDIIDGTFDAQRQKLR
jgi:hypothetical protein